ncbi:hypothetical protein F5X99DRAFT_148550 [Biscogniauxia marginata]|nr:hypothetical protein F5X99DRAFT_148550 [Biscogniauxia marginata]
MKIIFVLGLKQLSQTKGVLVLVFASIVYLPVSYLYFATCTAVPPFTPTSEELRVHTSCLDQTVFRIHRRIPRTVKQKQPLPFLACHSSFLLPVSGFTAACGARTLTSSYHLGTASRRCAPPLLSLDKQIKSSLKPGKRGRLAFGPNPRKLL